MAAKHILVVDDEPEIVELLRECLALHGYAVDAASDAAGALALVQDQIFDAAILDFNLPDMDGVMLHRRIREMDAELAQRTLFISGLVQSGHNLGYYSTSGGGFLSKPFEIRDVLEWLATMLPPDVR